MSQQKPNFSKIQRIDQSDPKHGIRRWLIREIMGTVMVAVFLFVSAGRLDWGMGWAMVGIYALWVAAQAVLLIPRNPALLIERANREKSGKRWDSVLLSLLGLSTVAKYIVAGLDFRFGWTGQVGLSLQLTALVCAVLGYALLTWSMVANAFFALVVRLQKERGQTVATSGPYRFVRHPGYSGSMVFELATPLMLGSLWALIPGGLGALLLVIRTALEDKTLQAELDGYQDYVKQTPYRLLPWVW
jgi:protein-S-isoprenylcysteine O-methyltransferase Ste14